MARQSKKKERDEKKARIEHLAILIDEFLEKDITEDDLTKHPEKIYRIQGILEEHLWQGTISPHDSDWQFESDYEIRDMPEQGAFIQHDAIQTGAQSIVSLHRFLKTGFWEQFKEHVIAYNEGNDYDPLRSDTFIDVETDDSVRIHATFGDDIHFFSSSLAVLRLLMNLIEGMRPEQFRKCADEQCGKFFFLTTNRNRIYCSSRCAARSGERRKREADRAAFNEYHRQYYNTNLKEGGSRT